MKKVEHTKNDSTVRPVFGRDETSNLTDQTPVYDEMSGLMMGGTTACVFL